MCGIVGYVGDREAAPIMLDGLHRLEYRGYDSAGAAVIDGGKIVLKKAKGEVRELDAITDLGRGLPGKIGIGHTRWATHGQPTDVNAHPHASRGGKIAAVHNGIIENYAPLREELITKGFTFVSETDTEVAVNLIQYHYNLTRDLLKAITAAAAEMEGSYALGILCEDCPDTLIATKRESPLSIGLGSGENYVASDVIALIAHTRDVYRMEDGEIAVLTSGGVALYDASLREIQRTPERVDWDVSAAEKGGYEHFMMKEIMEQPEAVRKTVSPRVKNGRVELDIDLDDEYIRKMSRIYIVACGSSYHVGVVAKYNMEKFVRIPVETVLASEFRYASPILNDTTLVICISQSGTTADTIAAMREAKRLGAKVLSIVNVVGSVIAQESDCVLYTWAGPEIAVATTKAYSTQLAVTYLLTLRFAEARGAIVAAEYERLLGELLSLPEKLERCLRAEAAIEELAAKYQDKDEIFFIGRNMDYALSLEGSLKLKEISYIHSEAYAGGELKHGTISLIEDGTLVIMMATYGALAQKIAGNAEEVRARGARVLTFTTELSGGAVRHVSDDVVTMPDTHEALLPSVAVVPLQLFAYHVAKLRGCSIDKPRNLAKSSTVE
jgi:glucosamine--fructose-6-phosphate aminotransferase (isomerizing)